MNHAGRQSAAELSVVATDGISTIKRPEPPACLSDAEAAKWRKIVNRMPADWFPEETHGLLINYCRHEAECDLLTSVLRETPPTDLERRDAYLRLRRMESAAMASLATRMRISQQSSYSARKSKDASTHKKPWVA